MPHCVPVNEKGYRIGEGHPRCTIPDTIVDQIRELREDRNYTLGMLVLKFKLPKRTIRDICAYERRAQTPERWKNI